MPHKPALTLLVLSAVVTGRGAAAQSGLARWVVARANLLIPIGLYLFAATLLLANLGGHPPFPYAWEPYTALRLFPFLDHPTTALFERNDAVMTDSGASPLVVLPISLGFALGGVNLLAMRVPVALLAALAVPLLWLVGKDLRGTRIAATASLLLALMPPFVLFGRTATNVGISLVPALLTVYALMRVLLPAHSLRWLVALQALLFLGQYAYSPIRILWPISLVLLLGEALFQREARRRLLVAFAVTAVVLPVLLVATTPASVSRPWEVLRTYFSARGEQALAFVENPDGIRGYLRSEPGAPEANRSDMLGRLVLQNAGDLARVLLDQQTAPTISNYWRSDGRLYFGVLVPFFLLGLVVCVATLRRLESRVLLGCFAGLTLPLLLTSRVDVGRMIFALPFLCLIVALGYWAAADWLANRISRWSFAGERGGQVVRYGGLIVLLVAVAVATWNDYRLDPPPSLEAKVAVAVREAPPPESSRTAPVALVLGGASDHGVELIQVSGLRLLLDSDYEFVDLTGGDIPPAQAGERTRLYFGGLLDAVGKAGAIPDECTALYIVRENLVDQFLDATTSLRSACGRAPSYVTLTP